MQDLDLRAQRGAEIACRIRAPLRAMGTPYRLPEGPIAQTVEETIHLAPVIAQRRIEKIAQPCLARFRRQMRDRLGEPDFARTRAFQNHLTRFGDQGARRRLVQDLEAGNHARLDRKARQHDLAEGMQREHLESARRLQRLGEEAAGLGQVVRLGADLANVPRQAIVRQHRPFAKLAGTAGAAFPPPPPW